LKIIYFKLSNRPHRQHQRIPYLLNHRSAPVPTVFQSNSRWTKVALQKLCITMRAHHSASTNS